ncbi:dimethyladenosine transferase, variant 3 [Schistosoma haematobium]|uniref:rRNA adenine N(6)-methyltransferase n=2 Tax=Schistosoma haematobium TaxID=6185 RepID=A0A094ZIZ1_SCHHA|nr:dimethyladenosine transferase, variant 3 [Schistosoma haematobium]KAH9594201.1 dimethyladenosine transferase, variant 3 [Schistosoma haematobium]
MVKPKCDSSGLAIKTGGIRFQKTKGQHILKNPLVITTMVEKSGIKSTDSLLEIGSGTGNLTVKLLEKGRKVYAFEIDPRMVSELQKRVQTSPHRTKLEILVGDAIKAKSWPKFDLCVANLPYKISSPFIQRLISAGRGFRAAVVMLQKEFADRLTAKPGDKLYCRLSASAQFHFKIEQLMKINRNSFRPPPRVDSAVVRIEPRHPLPPVMHSEWDGLLRLVFARKNKTIGANFSGKSIAAHLRKIYMETCCTKGLSPTPEVIACESTGVSAMEEKITNILRDSGFEKQRARTLDEDDFLRLLLAFKKENINFG